MGAISKRGGIRARRFAAAAIACALLAACEGGPAGDGGLDQPPRAKPSRIAVSLEGPTADTRLLGRVATRDGALEVLEPDGSVSRMAVSSPQGRSALGRGDGGLLRLQDVLIEDTSEVYEYIEPGPTAQERALEQFAARTGPALPATLPPFAAEDFIGAEIALLRLRDAPQEGGDDLVRVTVNLRRGVDDSVALAYATCSLAAWADRGPARYARHIRSLSANRSGVMALEAVFTMSRTQPMGLRVMETRQTLQDCRARGIPAGISTRSAQLREGT
ncbi:MAG: hypothetical protein Q4F71_09140 [Paracoccus sp. (in: a-proteobacteria)]|nr:hypothetical protein [Paracoccus sp. (in: a-proteobacteria)]